MKYLVDTCVLSELTKPNPAAGVVHWLREADEARVVVSVLTIGELEKGVSRLRTSKRKTALREWLDGLIQAYGNRVLDVTPAIAKRWGDVAAMAEARGAPLPVVDALIGATALVHELTVVTRNTTDVRRSGADWIDPWSEHDGAQ